ncbi:hypothetical protein CL656_07280 [bacterium]|nr:hypothetical protein [bacterium]|tara:strand:- start:320 stop:838 length:519 start_codon:yes stop_codon:yes gene_type:complete
MEKTLLSTQLVVLVLLLFLVTYTIIYIRELKNCVCFKTNEKYKVNLEFLEFYQYLELFSIFLIFLGLFSLNTKLTKFLGFKGGKKSNGFLMSLLLSMILIVYLLIKYNVMKNVYNLSTNIKYDCDCATKWQRFFLYYQGILNGIEVVHYSIGLLVVVIMLLSVLLEKVTKMF